VTELALKLGVTNRRRGRRESSSRGATATGHRFALCGHAPAARIE
jgi:hypothetical protein